MLRVRSSGNARFGEFGFVESVVAAIGSCEVVFF